MAFRSVHSTRSSKVHIQHGVEPESFTPYIANGSDPDIVASIRTEMLFQEAHESPARVVKFAWKSAEYAEASPRRADLNGNGLGSELAADLGDGGLGKYCQAVRAFQKTQNAGQRSSFKLHFSFLHFEFRKRHFHVCGKRAALRGTIHPLSSSASGRGKAS